MAITVVCAKWHVWDKVFAVVDGPLVIKSSAKYSMKKLVLWRHGETGHKECEGEHVQYGL